MVQIIPSIDLFDGRVVRLRQGNFSSMQTYAVDASQWLETLLAEGFPLVHIVDLEGARSGRPAELDRLRAMKPEQRSRIQWSGGIRDLKTAQEVADLQPAAIVLGSLAIQHPKVAQQIASQSNVAVKWALDTRRSSEGHLELRTQGWQEGHHENWEEVFQRAQDSGVGEIIVSSILHDGQMRGPDLDLYRLLKGRFSELSIIASGGVRDSADLKCLQCVGIEKAIVGRAWLESREAFL